MRALIDFLKDLLMIAAAVICVPIVLGIILLLQEIGGG